MFGGNGFFYDGIPGSLDSYCDNSPCGNLGDNSVFGNDDACSGDVGDNVVCDD
ncbi:hypothetical protein Riv7116_6460 [Rivularia sp. PCC 7116]|uniref:hypothetical protein n=1 Tax=Rivularia sp. PCC 7116 TaxID=373994 RepID=UPI00029F4A3E|nr:hypothetical protein [Rivularia sp. PCC 7116]AFY58790.1 hypothetical protein Riv7116_6460 [Rivularia sp. PCC 7116]